MPTIAGIRRRGYTPASIREFTNRIGVTKSDNTVEMGVLEDCIRTDLNENALRRMAVLHPLKVVITNYPDDQVEELTVANHPQNEAMGTRSIPFARELYIDRNDFAEDPPKKFKRLIPDGEVRLRGAYVIRCDEIIKDGHGEIIELRCTYDPDTLGKNPEGRKVKGVIHWVSAHHGIEAEVRLYDRLFSHPNPDAAKEGKSFLDYLNPDSLLTLTRCFLEPTLFEARPGEQFQFEREGYFCLDEMHSHGQMPVYNRIVTLRDTWAKIAAK
jgi:glutaminyl-tRNA synthetase